jgi:transposase
MWLLGRLVPDHKIVADFRKDNGHAIRKVCARFVELCREMGLLAKASVAIDGSKFKAVNNRDKSFTRAKMERRYAQLEESVARYLGQLDTADRQEPSEALAAKTTHLKEKLAKIKVEMERLKILEAPMLAAPYQQVSLTDPDSRSMATSGRGSGVVGYNVQVVVDTEHHLIVTHEVTNVGSDLSQLSHVAKEAKATLRTDTLEAVADHGYFSGLEILACEKASITVTLPKPIRSGINVRGLVRSSATVTRPKKTQCAYATIGQRLPKLRHQTRCTTAKERRIHRWEHEHILEAVQTRLDEHPEKIRQRRESVKHPFGTIKARMSATHFLMKTLPRVASEMALHVLAYNLTRVMNIMGIQPLMAAIRA